MPPEDDETLPSPLPQNGEIRSVFDMRVGRHIRMQASASVTPAGIVSAGIAVGLMTLALGYVAGALKRR